MNIILNLSGGVDSVFCLYDYLINHKDKILVHHCIMNNQNKELSDRANYELNAVKKVLNWLDSKSLNNYCYIESRFDHPVGVAIIQDIEIIGFMTGLIVKNNGISKCIIPANKHDLEVVPEISSIRRFKIIELVSDKKLQYLYPIKHLTKKQLMSKLPPDLLINCWSCRNPANGKVCKKCYACVECN